MDTAPPAVLTANGEESNIIEESIITEEDDDLDPEEIEKLMRGKLMEQDDEEDGEAWQDDIAPLSQIYDDHCEGDLVWQGLSGAPAQVSQSPCSCLKPR